MAPVSALKELALRRPLPGEVIERDETGQPEHPVPKWLRMYKMDPADAERRRAECASEECLACYSCTNTVQL